MKKWKKIIFAALLIFLVIVAAKYAANPERRIKKFVHQNSGELTAIAEACLKGGTTQKTFQGVEVEGVFTGSHPIVQFYSFGFGIVPASTYYGFYYSPDDVPAAFQNVDCELSEVSNAEWEWSDGTDNGGRTIRIMQNWFYYKAWF